MQGIVLLLRYLAIYILTPGRTKYIHVRTLLIHEIHYNKYVGNTIGPENIFQKPYLQAGRMKNHIRVIIYGNETNYYVYDIF